ncbi:MAG: endonuclease MutS2 [bacterium]|nr:endonuclease MutS2 [bacterium]
MIALDSLEFSRVLETVSKHAGTEMAREQLLTPEPYTDELLLQRELELLDRMWFLLEEGEPPFYELGDPRHTLRLLHSSDASVSPDEFIRLLHSLMGLRSVRKWFTDRAKQAGEIVRLAELITPRPDIEEEITRIIDPNGHVRDDASQELKRIRKELIRLDSQLRDTLEHTLRDWSAKKVLQEELITIRNGHYVLPVLATFRHRVSGVAQDSSNTGNTVFIEPLAIIELNNKLQALQNRELEEVARILRELANLIQPHVVEIEETLAAAVRLDNLSARTIYGMNRKGCLPQLSTTRELRLRSARHPLLQERVGFDSVVPLDLDLIEYSGRVLLISGPNAGGKTVTLKTTGLMVAMAMHAIPVTAGVAEIPFIREVFAVIGDDQSIEQDLSTFTAHLTSLERTLHTRAQTKLVLVDEICSGTDPAEGSALSRALLERWRDDGCFVVCTTHQSALKLFVQEEPGMVNGAMAFDEDRLLPTFRFRMGVPGSSYALEIAAKVKIPSAIRERAKEVLGDRTVRVEHLLEELANLRERAEAEKRETEKLRAEQSRQTQAAQADRETAKMLLLSAKQKASTLADDILKDANRRIEAVVRELREAQANKESIKQAHETLDAIRAELRSRVEPKPKKALPVVAKSKLDFPKPQTPFEYDEKSLEEFPVLKPGDLVQIRESGTEATVVAVSDDFIQVAAGSVKLRLSPDSIVPIVGGKVVNTTQFRSLTTSLGAANRIDIRGMTREEAIDALEKFLADAAAEGWEHLEIIHGKGMGVLKEATSEILRASPFVKTWRVGQYGEGSGGASLVTLK